MSERRLDESDSQRHWNKNAPHWAVLVRDGYDIAREYVNNPELLKNLGDLSGKLVLDAGCGEGCNTRLMAGLGGKMVGVDLSTKMIELAREQESNEPLGIRYENTSYSDLSMFEDETFDVVVSTVALMDSPCYREALTEFNRVLKPGGRLYFSITHPCFISREIRWLPAEEGRLQQVVVGGYFNTEPEVDTWHFSFFPDPEKYPPFTVPTFYRTLSEYVNTLIEAGFKLRRIYEPKPTEEGLRTHESLRRWAVQAALFLHFDAVKDES